MSRAMGDSSGLRDWLIRFLFASTAVQSFDGLVQRAARYEQFGTSGWAADWLPRLWAATIDAIWYAGLLGIQRHGGRDGLSWLAFLTAFGASFGFQVIGAKDVPVAAVPPVALLLVLIVMHAPRRAEPASAHDEASSATGNASPTAAAGIAPPAHEDPVPPAEGAGTAAPVPAPSRRELRPRPAVLPDAASASRERAGPNGNGHVPARPRVAGADPGDPDAMMRAYWAAERVKGRMPSGAELDRHVGRDPSNGAGRKARARYLREEAQGRFTAPAVPAPEASVPAAGALGGRERPGTALAGAPDWPTGPVPAGNGHQAPQEVPGTLEAFPSGHRDREGSDA